MTRKTDVPEAEQPYQIPDNWRWATIGAVSTLYRGVSYQKGDAHTVKGEDDILILRGGNIGEGHIDTDSDNVYVNSSLVCKHQIICKHDILIIGSTGSKTVIGRAGIALENYNDVAFGAFLILVRPAETINPQYLDYYFLSDDYRNRMKRLSKGININNIRADYITRCPVPFPPLAEQQRIVERIESLFAKLDAARENAQSVLDGAATRKAAILHRAFSGDLTRQWRENNGVSFDSWLQLGFEACVEKMQNGLAKRKGTTGNPVVVLRLANLSDDGFLTDDLREIVLDEKEQSSYLLHPGDILMIRVNGSKENVGKQFLITRQNAWAFCDHIIRMKCSQNIQPEYMTLFSKSETYKQYVKSHIVSSAGQNTISRRAMADLVIPVPTMGEQREIVRLLSEMLEKEQETRDNARQVLDNIDAMKRVILGRAFRGELGTNRPSEAAPEASR